MALRVTLLAMVALVIVSVTVFRVGLDISLVNAIYFVVTTITTVGYGDI